MDATDSSLQGNKTGSIRHWWGQSVRSAGGVGTGSGSDAARDDAARDDGVRDDGVRGGRSVDPLLLCFDVFDTWRQKAFKTQLLPFSFGKRSSFVQKSTLSNHILFS